MAGSGEAAGPSEETDNAVSCALLSCDDHPGLLTALWLRKRDSLESRTGTARGPRPEEMVNAGSQIFAAEFPSLFSCSSRSSGPKKRSNWKCPKPEMMVYLRAAAGTALPCGHRWVPHGRGAPCPLRPHLPGSAPPGPSCHSPFPADLSDPSQTRRCSHRPHCHPCSASTANLPALIFPK